MSSHVACSQPAHFLECSVHAVYCWSVHVFLIFPLKFKWELLSNRIGCPLNWLRQLSNFKNICNEIGPFYVFSCISVYLKKFILHAIDATYTNSALHAKIWVSFPISIFSNHFCSLCKNILQYCGPSYTQNLNAISFFFSSNQVWLEWKNYGFPSPAITLSLSDSKTTKKWSCLPGIQPSSFCCLFREIKTRNANWEF